MVVCKDLSEQPEPFTMRLAGPDGAYELAFKPGDRPSMEAAGVAGGVLLWWVDRCDRTTDGWELSGLTSDTKSVWGDVYWFVAHTSGKRRVEYWGDRVILRTDFEI